MTDWDDLGVPGEQTFKYQGHGNALLLDASFLR